MDKGTALNLQQKTQSSKEYSIVLNQSDEPATLSACTGLLACSEQQQQRQSDRKYSDNHPIQSSRSQC
jgi:hypothetical protein